MSRERLRIFLIDGIDNILNHPFWFPLKTDQRAVIVGQRQFWNKDDGQNLDKVLGYMGELHKQGEDMEKKTFDPNTLLTLFKDVVEFSPVLYDFLVKLFNDLKAKKFATGEAKCTHNGVKCCCDEALEHAVQVVAALVRCHCCCEDNCPVEE